MFSQLPEQLKDEVLFHLRNNDFPKAKAIHDGWLKSDTMLEPKQSKKNKQRMLNEAAPEGAVA